MTIIEIKQELRKLKKLKKSCRAGTKERLDLHHKILELQKQLEIAQEINIEKEKLIKEIMKLEKCSLFNTEYYLKFTEKQLEFHLERLQKRRIR